MVTAPLVAMERPMSREALEKRGFYTGLVKTGGSAERPRGGLFHEIYHNIRHGVL